MKAPLTESTTTVRRPRRRDGRPGVAAGVDAPASALGALALVALLGFSAGCGTERYRKSADKEVAGIIAAKSRAVPNMDPRFTIEQTNVFSLAGLPVRTNVEAMLGSGGAAEANAAVVSLEQALALAVQHSREHQNQRELVYLAALSLTLDRHRFTPIFSGGASSTAQNQPQDLARAIDQVAGTQSALLARDTEVVQQFNVSGRSSAGASVLLRSGAALASSFTVDFLRFLNGDPRFAVRSSLGATLTQPLLRGAGYKVTMENLTQSEREVLYALRDFAQARRDFSVRIAQLYYDVLAARDGVRNAWTGYRSLQRNLEMVRAMVQEGRNTQSDLGLLEQSALSAEARWVNTILTYKQSLDQFKLTLGLPTDARLMLDDRELAELKIAHPDLSAENAVKVGLATRLELLTAQDRLEDAQRKVHVAANGLKPRLDLVVGGSLDSRPGSNNPLDLDTQRARGNLGVQFDPALDRKGVRNAYRQSLIARERARRDAQLREDQIKLQIYGDWRNLDQARRNYEISELGVKLAQRRLEEQQLRMELGRGTMRDLVDAQTALVSSLDGRTAALVGHTTARLQFWRDMGILFIKENGKWEEPAKVASEPSGVSSQGASPASGAAEPLGGATP